MKKFVKHFIGKGKQVNGLQIIKVTVNMDGLEHFTYEFNGESYLTFEIAKMKNPDQFGREYTVYVSRQEEVKEETSPEDFKTVKKNKKTKKVKQTIDELPEDPF
jgi:hypothetical protein